MPATADAPPPPRARRGAWVPPESAVLGGAAIALGVLAGSGVWLFKRWIDVVHDAASGGLGGLLAAPWAWAVALLPVLGGLAVGAIRVLAIGEERHAGVTGIMEAVALAGGRLRWKRAPMKAVAAGIGIGSGASVGPEDPSVQIGAATGSMLGQTLRLSDDRTRALVAAGAAAGIAAAFDAPIAGVFFAVEIVLGEIAGGALGVVLLAAVCSAAVTHALSGEHPAFAVPAWSMRHALELPGYVVLGAVGGVVAALYVTAIHGAKDAFDRTPVPAWLRPAAAGLLVGALGLALPGILGVGYPTVESVLRGTGPALAVVAALLAGKLLATALCVGAGFQGGVFAPALFLGATLGDAVGEVLRRLVPAWGVEPAAFATVGMGAVLAGAVHAPLTAILLLFEMTRDYAIMVPAMLATATSLFVARRLRRDSVYTLALVRKGIRLERGRDVEVLEGLTVAETMQTTPPTIPESAPATAALDAVQRTRHLGISVVDADGRLAGIVVAQDLDRAAAAGRLDGRTVGEVCTRAVQTAFPDETLAAALARMSTRDVARLPVVARDDPRRLVGVLRRSDVVRAYDVALRRRQVARHRAQQVRLGAFTGASVEEARVEAGAPCDGRKVAEVGWPRECVLASVRRDARLLLPHGDTVLRAGDVLVAVADSPEAHAEVRRLCSTPPPVAAPPAPPPAAAG